MYTNTPRSPVTNYASKQALRDSPARALNDAMRRRDSSAARRIDKTAFFDPDRAVREARYSENQELDYQRGQNQDTNIFDANQRALTSDGSTGALWAASLGMNRQGTPIYGQTANGWTARPIGYSGDYGGNGMMASQYGGGGSQAHWANQAYNSETNRQALTGLMGAFQGMAGGGGFGGQGLNVTGPNGPIASVNYNSSINPQQQVFNPQAGMQQMQAPPAHYANTPGAQAAMHSNVGVGQANAALFDRQNTQNQGQYYNQATQAQYGGALAGLGQSQRSSAAMGQRRNRMFGMGTNIASQLMAPRQ